MNDSFNLKNPSGSAVSNAQVGISITMVLSRIAVAIWGAFIVCVILVDFFSFGRVTILGRSLNSITLSLANWAAITMLLWAALIAPIEALSKKIILYRDARDAWLSIQALVINGSIDPEPGQSPEYLSGFMQRVHGTRYNCMAVSSVLAALVGLLCYNSLLNSMDAPWAHLLTMAIVYAAVRFLSSFSFSIASRSLKRENPKLYREALEAMRNAAQGSADLSR